MVLSVEPVASVDPVEVTTSAVDAVAHNVVVDTVVVTVVGAFVGSVGGGGLGLFGRSQRPQV